MNVRTVFGLAAALAVGLSTSARAQTPQMPGKTTPQAVAPVPVRLRRSPEDFVEHAREAHNIVLPALIPEFKGLTARQRHDIVRQRLGRRHVGTCEQERDNANRRTAPQRGRGDRRDVCTFSPGRKRQALITQRGAATSLPGSKWLARLEPAGRIDEQASPASRHGVANPLSPQRGRQYPAKAGLCHQTGG